jgi:hypothetical protein
MQKGKNYMDNIELLANQIRAGEYPARPVYDSPVILQVGFDKPYKTPAAALADAQSGDIIEIDAGEYYNADAVMLIGSRQNELKDLTIRGVGGRACMIVSHNTPLAAGGEGIWSVYAHGTHIENIGFSGAAFDGSASGVRINATDTVLRNCRVSHNNMGVLTYNADQHNGGDIILIECELDGNGDNSGYSHNVYIGNGCENFWLIDCLSTGVRNGYLAKSRAKNTHIISSSLMTGSGSGVPLDVPNGGNLYVISSTIQNTESDSRLIRYDEESTAEHHQSGLCFYLLNSTFMTADVNNCFDIGAFRKHEVKPAIYNCTFV